VGFACRGARSRGDRRSEIEIDPKRRCLRHDMSNLALETVEESRTFGEDIVLIGLRELTCKAEELLALPMIVVEEQAKELGVDAA
jgi:hypothetical protein